MPKEGLIENTIFSSQRVKFLLMSLSMKKYSDKLQQKIDALKIKRKPLNIGSVQFASPLVLAPMAGICNAPFRALMEELGAGFTVSELISCHGINYKNKYTLEMLKLHPKEKNMGIQLFGETADEMAEAAQICESYGPKIIDINMGCPVKKVVAKGAGSALMKEPKLLVPFFTKIKNSIKIPLTIKIRSGWDQGSLNADEILKIAKDCGIEFVAIHGRTRSQQYTGFADWDYIENLANKKIIPLIGNGDLHTPYLSKDRMSKTGCDALMIARGALRNPFIFLESYGDGTLEFVAEDYFEIINRLKDYSCETMSDERGILVSVRKMMVWFAAGFPHSAKFRGSMFQTNTLDEAMKLSEDFFLGLGTAKKHIDLHTPFMTSGHG